MLKAAKKEKKKVPLNLPACVSHRKEDEVTRGRQERVLVSALCNYEEQHVLTNEAG